MHRAEVLSQSMKPKAYAIGSHIRLIDPLEPPFPMNHSENEMLSKLRMSCNAPSKSNRARTTGSRVVVVGGGDSTEVVGDCDGVGCSCCQKKSVTRECSSSTAEYKKNVMVAYLVKWLMPPH